MIKYPDNYNPIRTYWERIQNGTETVSDKVRRVYKKLADDLEHPGKYHYSAKRAKHIIEFFENYCHHSKGKAGGQLVVLELWEKALLAAVFGFVDDQGLRKYQRAVLIVGKKNGKSLIASGVGTYMLIGDGEAGPEVYAVATKRDQAGIIWKEAKRMVNKSPALRKRIKPLVGELSSEAYNAGTFKPLASDSNTLDGLNIHCALMDEIHQWKNGRALYNIIADGVSAREQPLVFITSTAGTVRDDIYDDIYDECERIINGYDDPNGYKDDRTIAFVYELDARKEWTDENCWKKANPGLGTIKNLTTLRHEVEKAKQEPLLVKNLVCKQFNIRETSSEAWLTFEQLDNREKFSIDELKPRYGVGGVDLSSCVDLTCATMLFQVRGDERIYVEQMYWIPEDNLEKRIHEDKIPYDIWIDQGWCSISPGNKIDYHLIVDWFIRQQEEKDIYLWRCGYDSWSAKYFVDDMENTFGKQVMEPVIQGKKTLSAPMKNLGADISKKLVVYNNNPILKWCLTNTSVDVDKNDNIQPMKVTEGKSTRRIDGVASLLDAYVIRDKYLEEYKTIM
ncbi:MAG: terminase large subunit [Lachnospiraceae bacterium]|nr:terminase large subunit [Lachnospiraceae bacterium]